jgi:hypothetical protein
MNNLLQDVRSVYTLVEQEALSRSYSLALEQAIGRRQNDFCCVYTHFLTITAEFPNEREPGDSHDGNDSLDNPVSQLRDSFAFRVTAQCGSFPSFQFQAARRPLANAAPARTGPPPHRLRRVTQQLRAAPRR